MKNELKNNPAYVTARDQATRLQNELAKLDAEIAAHDASALESTAFSGAAKLHAGLVILDGKPFNSSKQRADLCERRAALAASIAPAHNELESVGRKLSREYFNGRAPDLLAALDGLVAALASVVAAGDAFKNIREAGESLGYDYEAAGLPVAADRPYSEWVEGRLPELRKSADRLRDSLDDSLDKLPPLQVRALCDVHGLKCGQYGAIPAREARELLRCSSVEVADPRKRLAALL